MKKIPLCLVIALFLTCITACHSSNRPESVAKQAITALQKSDYDKYAATFDLSPSDQKILAGMAEEKVGEIISDKGGIKSFKISNSEVNGDNATVKVRVIYKDASEEIETMSFAKVDGEWKQELDK